MKSLVFVVLVNLFIILHMLIHTICYIRSRVINSCSNLLSPIKLLDYDSVFAVDKEAGILIYFL